MARSWLSSRSRHLLLASALALVAPAALPGVSHADEPVPAEKAKSSVAPENVYLGNAANFTKPAEVDADAVYAEIAEYKRVRDESIQPGTAEYDLLMSKASRRFYKALRQAQKDGGYDLVARSGSVTSPDAVPDVTADVIAAL